MALALQATLGLFDFMEGSAGVGTISSICKPALPLDDEDGFTLVKSWIENAKVLSIMYSCFFNIHGPTSFNFFSFLIGGLTVRLTKMNPLMFWCALQCTNHSAHLMKLLFVLLGSS